MNTVRYVLVLGLLCSLLGGCWYTQYQQAVTEAVSPEYRAYQAQQQQLQLRKGKTCTALPC